MKNFEMSKKDTKMTIFLIKNNPKILTKNIILILIKYLTILDINHLLNKRKIITNKQKKNLIKVK